MINDELDPYKVISEMAQTIKEMSADISEYRAQLDWADQERDRIGEYLNKLNIPANKGTLAKSRNGLLARIKQISEASVIYLKGEEPQS